MKRNATRLTHINAAGEAHMVDVSGKPVVRREAVATGRIFLKPATVRLIRSGRAKKGDVLAVARVAAITAAKRTSELIPLCHNIPLNRVEVALDLDSRGVKITATAICDGKTGVEMEALTAASTAALTIYDMCKAVDKKMIIGDIRLEKKTKRAPRRTR